MKTFSILLLLAWTVFPVFSQDMLTGFVEEKDEQGIATPLTGVNVFWLGTNRGTTTDTSGGFILPIIQESKLLVLHNIGYQADTLLITTQRALHIFLKSEAQTVGDVNVLGERPSSYLEYASPFHKNVLTEKELFKAACCNLSESFQTNPSIDVSFTDAITGTKQIEMLGLSGIYTQTTLENMPYIRGLTSNIGLTFIPGTWIEAINVSKGIGSVANGYESITGQIDVDLRKPQKEEEKQFFLNLYGNMDQRLEANLNVREKMTDQLSSMTFLHVSSQRLSVDDNGDGFLDMPRFTTINLMQRWMFTPTSSWFNQAAVQYVRDTKDGGTYNREIPYSYSYGTTNTLLRIYGKTGYVFQGEHGRSLGVQWSLSQYRNASHFGMHLYDGNEETGYFNLLYQAELDGEVHKFRTGMSFMYDQFSETFNHLPYQRIERVPGMFFEYTFNPNEEFSLVAGFRVDQHNAYGSMTTPRLHIRYTPDEDWVLRIAAGRGYRTANIFTENSTVFASSRTITLTPTGTFGYGLKQEIAWNYGFNLTHYFLVKYRPATLMVDLYRTEFEQLVLADLDANPHQVRFYSVPHGSYSNSIQTEMNLQPLERLDVRIAYRYLDVKQKLDGVWRERPFTAQHRALATVSYATVRDQPDGPQTSFDITIQWFGRKRIPDTYLNPDSMHMRAYSPGFITMNLQTTRTLIKGLDIYLGIENLFDFKQTNPILDAANPRGSFFDASLIWGPVTGRMVYTGLRFRL
jgi:outer membrane receptor for ferrienterochelin and colicins